MKLRNVLIVVAPLAWGLSAGGAANAQPVNAQPVVQCESRDYQYQFCPTPGGVTRARLVEQRSRAACVEGRSWGYDRRGIWVSGGCDGVFEYQGFGGGPGNNPYRPGPVAGGGAGHLVCESQEYEYNLCQTGRIRNAQLVRQLSQAPCVQGQTWGVSRDGIWVDRGCEAEFRIIQR